MQLDNTLKKLTSKQWDVYVNLIQSGSTPNVGAQQTQQAGMVGGETGGAKPKPTARQHGGPLYPGGSYALHEGEFVQMGSAGGHATPGKDIIDYDLLASKISQSLLGPFEDFTQKMVIALG